jgi:regulator of protease activity HflC (stomatin/prohibitin superfamily)
VAHCAFSWGSFASPSENAASLQNATAGFAPAKHIEKGKHMWTQIILGLLVGVPLGLFLVVLAFALLTPLFIKQLVNQPGRTEKSSFHLFTYPEEGKVKIVVRGDRIVRMIMLYAGHRFARIGDQYSSSYWQIIETGPGEASENPLTGISPLLSLWSWYVYETTGAVFTGLYPWQTVREYSIERTKMRRDESDSKDPKGNNIALEVKEDISDHYRARQFLYPFRVAAADTKDKISVNVLAVIKARTTNPHKAAFGTDRWDHQMVNLATNAVTNFTRANNLNQVLTAIDEKDARKLNEAVQAIDDDEKEYGIEIEGVDLIDISPNLSATELEKLYAEALAKPVGEATLIDAKKRAEGLRALNEAHKAGGDYSIETQRAEAFVRAAGAAKEGTVIMSPGGGSGSDPTQAAILAELRKLNRKRKAT